MSTGVVSMQISFTSTEPEDLTHIKNLGRGGFGIVTLERHKDWGKVAVKQVVDKR